MSKNLPHDSNQRKPHVVGFQKSEAFSGPVPHPEIIEKYEQIYPGAAKMIFEKWDAQVKHRHGIENSLVRTDNAKSLLGLIFGFIVAMSSIGAGVYCAIHGMLLYAGGLSLSAIALIVAAFVTSKKK